LSKQKRKNTHRDLWKCSVMLQKEFPSGDSKEEREAARKLCMKDALLGALVITLVIMVIDQAGRDISPWWWYLFLGVILYLAECMVNWKRYRSQLPKEEKDS